jgi:hypothetical protein
MYASVSCVECSYIFREQKGSSDVSVLILIIVQIWLAYYDPEQKYSMWSEFVKWLYEYPHCFMKGNDSVYIYLEDMYIAQQVTDFSNLHLLHYLG